MLSETKSPKRSGAGLSKATKLPEGYPAGAKSAEGGKTIRSRKGQGMLEYALVLFLIAFLAFLAVETFGKRIRYGFISAGNKVHGICDDNPGIQN